VACASLEVPVCQVAAVPRTPREGAHQEYFGVVGASVLLFVSVRSVGVQFVLVDK